MRWQIQYHTITTALRHKMRGGEEGLLNGNTAAMSRRRDAPVFCYGLFLGPFSKSLIFYKLNKRYNIFVFYYVILLNRRQFSFHTDIFWWVELVSIGRYTVMIAYLSVTGGWRAWPRAEFPSLLLEKTKARSSFMYVNSKNQSQLCNDIVVVAKFSLTLHN